MCTVTGSVVQADGSGLKNGTITFNSQRIQVINSTVVNPTVVTTNTDTAGNIRAISLPQGLVMQITVCPPATGQGQSSNCAAPYSVFIPFTQTANFGQLSQGTQLSVSGALTANNVTVNNLFTAPDTSTWSTTGFTLATGSTFTFPDGSTYTSAGHNNMKALGIGVPAPTSAGLMENITNNFNGGTGLEIANNSTGTSAGTSLDFEVGASAGASRLYVGINGTANNTAAGGGIGTNTAFIDTNGAGGMAFLTGSTGNFPFNFYTHGAGARVTINDSGISTTGTYQVSGAQIKTTNLSDVSYGTWTPSFSCSTGSATYTASGDYRRIGDIAILTFGMNFSAIGTCGSGWVNIGNLPWSCATEEYPNYAWPNWVSSPLLYTNMNMSGGNVIVWACQPGNNYGYLYFMNNPNTYGYLGGNSFTNTSTLTGTLFVGF
jgi:hypothetical protein